jgi:hypothetical protein
MTVSIFRTKQGLVDLQPKVINAAIALVSITTITTVGGCCFGAFQQLTELRDVTKVQPKLGSGVHSTMNPLHSKYIFTLRLKLLA